MLYTGSGLSPFIEPPEESAILIAMRRSWVAAIQCVAAVMVREVVALFGDRAVIACELGADGVAVRWRLLRVRARSSPEGAD
jgi:hypothetical protein